MPNSLSKTKNGSESASTYKKSLKELEKSLKDLKKRYSQLDQKTKEKGIGFEESNQLKEFQSTLSKQSRLSSSIAIEKENTEKAASEYLKRNRKFEAQLNELKLENKSLNAKLEAELHRNQELITENNYLKHSSDNLENKVNT